jgi:hypothetical protein
MKYVVLSLPKNRNGCMRFGKLINARTVDYLSREEQPFEGLCSGGMIYPITVGSL